VELESDVSCLFVNGRHSGDPAVMAAVDAFRKKSGVEVLMMEPPKPPHKG